MKKTKVNKVGVVHGRFQPFHNDHLAYVIECFKKVDFLYIGITNPDPHYIKEDVSDVHRSKIEANPFSYYERYMMIKYSLTNINIDEAKFAIVPFPINFPDVWKYYVPMDAIFFLTIFDEWGRKKKNLLEEQNLTVDVLWEKNFSEKKISGTHIRNLIRKNNNWKHLVPSGTFKYIKENHLENKISS